MFKDNLNRWRTASLFYELNKDGFPSCFTTRSEDRVVDGVTYKSFRRLYLSYNHVPGYEYDFANECLGGWEHWLAVRKGRQLQELITSCQAELDIKARASAIKSIVNTAVEGEGNTQLSAAKWLAEKGYIEKRGRPTKAEKEGYLKQEESLHSAVEDDLQRVLKVIK
jgi:hypothetical protein